MENKGFEIDKCYEHFGKGKVHIIADSYLSKMWFGDEDGRMLIGEERSGSLRPISTDISNAIGWYEISHKIFDDDLMFEQFEYFKGNNPGTNEESFLLSHLVLRIYQNGEVYLFQKLPFKSDDEQGLTKNICGKDPKKALEIIREIATEDEIFKLEQKIFEKV